MVEGGRRCGGERTGGVEGTRVQRRSSVLSQRPACVGSQTGARDVLRQSSRRLRGYSSRAAGDRMSWGWFAVERLKRWYRVCRTAAAILGSILVVVIVIVVVDNDVVFVGSLLLFDDGSRVASTGSMGRATRGRRRGRRRHDLVRRLLRKSSLLATGAVCQVRSSWLRRQELLRRWCMMKERVGWLILLRRQESCSRVGDQGINRKKGGDR